MTHYICTGGCMGESPNPGVCQSTSCEKYGQPLEECECDDGRHPAQYEKKAEDGDAEMM